MLKFKKNDLVSIDFSAFCSVFNAHNDEAEAEPVEYHKVLNCRMTDTGIEYKLRGCYGWWKEEHLSLKPEVPKFSPSRDEAVGLDTNTLKVENVSESKNKAFWKESCMPGEYMCSNCSCFAMHKSDGTESPTKFCPHCGKLMTNWEDFI